MKQFLYILFFSVLSLGVWAQEIDYGTTRQTYEIADIAIEGADNYEDFVLIGFSGLRLI